MFFLLFFSRYFSNVYHKNSPLPFFLKGERVRPKGGVGVFKNKKRRNFLFFSLTRRSLRATRVGFATLSHNEIISFSHFSDVGEGRIEYASVIIIYIICAVAFFKKFKLSLASIQDHLSLLKSL